MKYMKFIRISGIINLFIGYTYALYMGDIEKINYYQHIKNY